MPTSYHQSIPTIVDIITHIKPKKILDIGIGRGKYGLLAKEYCEGVVVDGVEAWPEYISEIQKAIYRKIYIEDVTKMDLSKLDKDYDLILMIDVIEHFNKDVAYDLLDRLKNRILISTPIEDYRAHYDNHFEDHVSHWNGDDFMKYECTDFSGDLSTIVLVDTRNTDGTKLLIKENRKLKDIIRQKDEELEAIYSSKAWAAVKKYRKTIDKAKGNKSIQ